MRLQPIVVTLAVMFIVQGLTLLVMATPGGFVAPSLSSVYLGDTLPGLLPAPLTLLGVLVLAWLWLKRTAFGVTLYAVGSDPEAARATGLHTRAVTFFTYMLAGGLYGLAGVFVSAQTGSGDPLALRHQDREAQDRQNGGDEAREDQVRGLEVDRYLGQAAHGLLPLAGWYSGPA